MNHKKWEPGTLYAKALRDITNEHNALYDDWKRSEYRVMETMDENNRLDRELDEARKRIAELEAPPVINKVTGLPTGEYVALRPATPTDAQVEALARVLRHSYCDTYGIPAIEPLPDHYKDHARAAIAHFGAPERPKGLPSIEELARIGYIAWNEKMGYTADLDGEAPDYEGELCAATAILTALAPYLREPVGWELDVTPQEIYGALYSKVNDMDVCVQAVLDLCRSRIKPVTECKECKNWEAVAMDLQKECCVYTNQIDAARAALEGE